MLEKAIADIQYQSGRSVDNLECYDPNNDDSTTQLNDAQSRLKEILAGSNAQVTEYIPLLQKKGWYHFSHSCMNRIS